MGRLSEPLRDYALSRCLEAAPHLESIPDVFAEYTDHGVAHSCEVLKLADKLLAKNELSEWESLIFVLSAFYHDIGMSCPPAELESIAAEPRFRREHRYLRDLVLPAARLLDDSPETVGRIEYLRRHHGERCQNWIAREFPAERPQSMVEDLYVWEIVSTVCVGHTLAVQELQSDVYTRAQPIGMGKSVDVRFLTCLLRLADICHFSRDRALPYLRQTMKFTSRHSEKVWEALGEVAGVDCDEDRAVISVAAQPRSFERHRMISTFIAEIQAELHNAHRLLAETGWHQLIWKFVDDRNVRAHPSADYVFEPNARFRLVQDKIVHLLMGSKLYADPLYALRECLQNSIDAMRLYRLKDGSAVSRIVVQHRVDPDGSALLEVFDNGTGMDRSICLQHLLSVGSEPFASSERRYHDWGAPAGDLQLIAQHGIGFLSCFMLADRVDVFSKYPDAPRIHLVLDSPTLIGEFRTTDEAHFPHWDPATLPESSPWDERHGTCVRLHLREEISKFELVNFLARNVLRTGERIIVIYGNESVELPQIWESKVEWLEESEREGSLAKLMQKLSAKKADHSFYDGPPRDPSSEGTLETNGDIRGIVRLSHERGDRSRLSQEGFLVRDGVESLLAREAGTRGALDFPFYFDVDVRRERCFDLDAERARITDEQGTLTTELLSWIEERGLRCVSVIQSPLFFPCGGTYYHGGPDLLAADDTRVVAFHESLRRWYSPERMVRVVAAGKFGAFVEAKLFAVIGQSNNSPLSIAEMLSEQFFVLVPRIKFLTKEFDEDLILSSERSEERLRAQTARELLQEVAKLATLDKVVLLPNFPESFSLPLSVVFRFEWNEVSSWALLGRLVQREAWEVPKRDLIEEKFKKAGGFVKSKSVARTLSARRKKP